MTNLPVLRPDAGEVSTDRHDPRDDWPDEARALRLELVDLYGSGDALPDVAGAWIARQRSPHTRRSYARGFRVWDGYCRRTRVHPFQATPDLADAYSNYLETAPTMRRTKGGQRGEMAATGKPRSDTARAQVLSAAGSFYAHVVRRRLLPSSPFDGVTRPRIDRDYSPTVGMTPQETQKLIITARDWSPRAYAVVTMLYLLGPRVDELLRLDVEQLGYDKGHRVLPLVQKGNERQNVPVPPLALDALLTYLDGRTTGPLFATRTGSRLSEPAVWKLLRSLAHKAGLPQADNIKPHTLRHNFITDSVNAGVLPHLVQEAANHKDPRTTGRYIHSQGLLDNHPAYTLSGELAKGLARHAAEEA